MFFINALVLAYTKTTNLPKKFSLFGKFIRFFIRVFSNIFFPLMFRFNRKKYYLKGDGTCVVSLTSFPERIDKIHLVVECLLRQSVKPSKIILWLSSDQFKSYSQLPNELINQTQRGLDIRLVKGNLFSHKKYFYTLPEFPDSNLVTVDDDFFYPSYLLENLLDANRKFPNAICCCRGLKINIHNDQIDKYSKWFYLKEGYGPCFNIFQTSGGGSLYPPNSLHEEVLNDLVFMKLCPSADDVWLNLMAQLKKTQTLKITKHFEGIPILVKNNLYLSKVNVGLGQNDVQILNVRKYLIEKFNFDPLSNILNSNK
jgi:hypothetical protein